MELTIEKIQEYKKVKEFLDDVCEKYFEAAAPDWRHYGGWEFLDNQPNYIAIHYGYYDWRDQYESSDEIIPMDVLVEFSKTTQNE
jgi:hypothetical protein